MAQPPVEFQEARTALSIREPYLSDVLWRMIYVAEPRVGTMGVDKYWRLYVNEDFLRSMDINARVAVLRHEAQHLCMDHSGRGEPYKDLVAVDNTGNTVSVANIAADCEVNGSDIMTGYKIPQGCVLPDHFGFKRGLLMEEYIELLQNKFPEKVPMAGGNGNEGSGAGSQEQPWELGESATDENGEPVQKVDKWEQESARDEVAKAVQKRGNSAGNMSEWANKRLKREVSWKALLSRFYAVARTRRAGVGRPTFMVPDRKRKSRVLYPSWISPKVNVAVILDTSGSMDSATISLALTEICELAKAAGDPVTLYEADTKVQFKRVITSVPESFQIHGRGGTSMANAMKEVMAQKGTKPDVLIVMTDCETDWPSEKLRVPTMILDVGYYDSEHYRMQCPEWAQVVRIKRERRA